MLGDVLKIGILGCRGIPNRYGGFEQFAQHCSVNLAEKGHQVWVYQSSLHPYKKDAWNGVTLIRQYDPEDKLGPFGQFIYDFNCLSDARKRDFDILLQLGYTSNAIWFPLWPKKAANVVHMDGFEWKRPKYIKPVRRFLKLMEKIAVSYGDALVADSPVIQSYLSESYKKTSYYIPYGVSFPVSPKIHLIENRGLSAGQYFLAIARLVPENNVETIIEGIEKSNCNMPLVIIGDTSGRYARSLIKRYGGARTIFWGSEYNRQTLDSLRHYCRLYFHGHSVGGTNPSLLEAMAHEIAICAHENPFNRRVLGTHAFYFRDSKNISDIATVKQFKSYASKWGKINRMKIKDHYQWDEITYSYERLFHQIKRFRTREQLVLKNESLL
jgi:glycosyltransferase involved in cell wall biosynthesis